MFKTGCVCQHGGCVKTKSNDQLVESAKQGHISFRGQLSWWKT